MEGYASQLYLADELEMVLLVSIVLHCSFEQKMSTDSCCTTTNMLLHLGAKPVQHYCCIIMQQLQQVFQSLLVRPVRCDTYKLSGC